MVQALWKTVWRNLRKLNVKPRLNPEISPLGLYLDTTFSQKLTCTTMDFAEGFKMGRT